MKGLTERFHFIEPIFNTSKLCLIRLSVYNSVLNITERKNNYLNASMISTIPLGAYKLVDIGDIIKQETKNNVLIQAEKNTMKCKTEMLQDDVVIISFELNNSVGLLLGLIDKSFQQVCI